MIDKLRSFFCNASDPVLVYFAFAGVALAFIFIGSIVSVFI